ncbi:DNA-binding protein [Salmonella enterica]|nr:DNA-binding protein [Salmonella enterica]
MTPEQARKNLRRKGMTVTAWANENGFDRNLVYQVLNGRCKANFGKGHEIAIKLGLKTNSVAA